MTRNTISTVENIFSDGQITGSRFEPVTRENTLFKDSLLDRTRSLRPCGVNLLSRGLSTELLLRTPSCHHFDAHTSDERGSRSRSESQRRDRDDKKHHLDR
jgi:hypothetical protein